MMRRAFLLLLLAGCGARTELGSVLREEQDAAVHDAPMEGPSQTDAPVTTTLRVFVTQGSYAPTFGGLAGADAICMKEASAAALGGTFRAWLSDMQESPASRFFHSPSGWIRTDGVLFTPSWNDLVSTGLPAAPLNVTASGAPASTGDELAWTGTKPDGTSAVGACSFCTNDCQDWSSTTMNEIAQAGQLDDLGEPGLWTAGPGNNCGDFVHRLYCFEQP